MKTGLPTSSTTSSFRGRIHSGLIICLLVISQFAVAQTGSIVGRVIDSETLEPLPFANVFINNTTFGTAADANGQFALRDIPVGQVDVIFSFVGYQSYQTRQNLAEGQEIKLNIRLIPQAGALQEVQVKATRDKAWDKQMKKFELIFFGDEEFAQDCKILNSYVIDFPESDNGRFIAKASAPIEIVNNATGYKLTFYLKDFWSDGVNYSIVGNVRFENMVATDATQATRWVNNRKTAYLGSSKHFLKSLIKGDYEEQGFKLYEDIVAKVTTRASTFGQSLNKTVEPFKPLGVVQAGNTADDRKVVLKKRLEVHFLNKAPVVPVYRDVGHCVSWLETKNGSVLVNTEGVVLTPLDLIVSGDMSKARVSNMLPLDYQTNQVIRVRTSGQLSAERLFESVYLQLNKPFFYPGETMWFKGYMRYRVPAMVDSLSQVLYVDVIDGNRKVVLSRTVHIDSGTVAGNITFPNDLPAGTYGLMAYTNWMRNYGMMSYFTCPVPVLGLYDKVIPSEEKVWKNSPGLNVSLDKETYKTREKVSINFDVKDQTDKPLAASLSVAVTDANQVPPVPWNNHQILNDYPLPTELNITAEKFTHRIERGITYFGQFNVNAPKKTKKFDLMIIRQGLQDVRNVIADERGFFMMNDLQVEDSVLYAYRASKDIQQQKGKVVAMNLEKPLTDFKPSDYKIETERKETVQRVLSNYELPKDATLLQAVEIKATKLDDKPQRERNLFGTADVTIESSELEKSGTLGAYLTTRVPTYILYYDGAHWFFVNQRARLSSRDPFAITEPILVVDNRQVFLGPNETVGDWIVQVNKDNIDHVEISLVASSFTGATGSSGVLAFFMKRGSPSTAPTFNEFYIKGWQTPSVFYGPDYSIPSEEHSQGDFRSTIYWNNNLKQNAEGAGSFSFYTADLPGTYRIIIEGITSMGKPLRWEKKIVVESR